MTFAESILTAANLQVHTNFGVVEQVQVPGQGIRPMKHVGGADMKFVLEDFNHSLVYIRETQPQRVGAAKMYIGCDNSEKRTFGYRIVILANRADSICENLSGALLGAQSSIANADLRGATGADFVNVTGVTTESNGLRVVQSEAPGMDLPLQWTMGYIDLTVEAIGEPACFTDCAVTEPISAECPYTITIMLDGVQVGTAGPFDPCVNNTLNIVLA